MQDDKADSQTTLTQDGEIGVSLAAIAGAGLCPICMRQLRRLLAKDIQDLRERRAHLRGQMDAIDELILDRHRYIEDGESKHAGR